MCKNIKILGILLTAVILTSVGKAFANQSNLVTSLIGTSVKSTTVGIGSKSYPALYTKKSTYASLFAFQTSKGTAPYYDATAEVTFTVSKLGSVENEIVIIKQKNKIFHILNSYSGIVYY